MENFVGIRTRFGLANDKFSKELVRNPEILEKNPKEGIRKTKGVIDNLVDMLSGKDTSDIAKEIEQDFHNLPSHMSEIVSMKETSNPLDFITEKKPENVRFDNKGRIKIRKRVLKEPTVEFSILKETFFYLNEDEDVPIFREISTFSRDILNPM